MCVEVGAERCGSEAAACTDLVQVVAELADKRFLAMRPWKQRNHLRAAASKERKKRSRWTSSQTNESTGNHSFGFQFAERHMDRPLVRADGAKAVIREIGAFTDAHAGMANQAGRHCAEIIAAEQFLLEQLILFRW